MDKEKYEKWAKDFPKIQGVHVELNDLISQIKADQKKRTKLEDPISINIFMKNEKLEKSTTGLNGQFIHSLLLIDVLLRLKSNDADKQELIELCKKIYNSNNTELDLINEFEENYSSSNALWWYTRDSFLYKMLNKALRIQNIDVLFLFRFFIKDLYQGLKKYQCQSSIQVYRGQVLPHDELDILQKSIGQFISINSFFSTSKNPRRAMRFLYNLDASNNLQPILFEIDADPSAVTTRPFADISSKSDFKEEAEVLFMIGSIFHLTDISQDSNKIWIIKLKLCHDNDNDLANLFQYLKNQFGGGDNEVSLLYFGKVLHQMGKFDLAEKFYCRLLKELPSNDKSLSNLYYSLGLVLQDKENFNSSLEYLHKSLEILLQTSPHDYINIGNRYNAIGNLHRRRSEFRIALSWYNQGVQIYEQENARDHPHMASFYNNIAIVYEKEKRYTEALDFNNKALSLHERHLPSHHPHISACHNNIGIIYRHLGKFDLALEHYHQSLEIELKSRPANHPNVAMSYKNLGLVWKDKGQLNEALKHYEKAATIYRQTFSPQHPKIVSIEECIKHVSSQNNKVFTCSPSNKKF